MTRNDVVKLKEDWRGDPCWDIEETEGFEEFKDELLHYRLEVEKEWLEHREQEEREIDATADKIGIRGLYRMILSLQRENQMLRDKIENMGEYVNMIPRQR